MDCSILCFLWPFGTEEGDSSSGSSQKSQRGRSRTKRLKCVNSSCEDDELNSTQHTWLSISRSKSVKASESRKQDASTTKERETATVKEDSASMKNHNLPPRPVATRDDSVLKNEVKNEKESLASDGGKGYFIIDDANITDKSNGSHQRGRTSSRNISSRSPRSHCKSTRTRTN